MRKRKEYRIPARTNHIWNRHDFMLCCAGNGYRLRPLFRHIGWCLKWSRQRIARGYCDADMWEMYGYLQKLLPDMLQTLKDYRHSSPGYLAESGADACGARPDSVSHAEWDRILDRMIFLWKETDEEMCSRKNPCEEAYLGALFEFEKKYGILGEKLQTKEEKETSRRGGGVTVHFMDELPEYREISERYQEEARKLEKYQSDCKDEAMDMLKQYFFDLWD